MLKSRNKLHAFPVIHVLALIVRSILLEKYLWFSLCVYPLLNKVTYLSNHGVSILPFSAAQPQMNFNFKPDWATEILYNMKEMKKELSKLGSIVKSIGTLTLKMNTLETKVSSMETVVNNCE